MVWKKCNFHFQPSGKQNWSLTHATVPTPLHIYEDFFRVYYSTRDVLQRNRVGFIEIELGDEVKIVRESETPVIDLGELGHFDCDGIYGTSIVQTEKEIRFYYAGWNAGLRGTFYSSIGVAISHDHGQSFTRFSKSPILARDGVDNWAVMAPYVIQTDVGKWTMWYASGIKLYHDASGRLRSLYDIKTANSSDGFNWIKTGKTAIALGSEDTNIARTCVLKSPTGYEAWYPYIRDSIQQYRIGYGTSSNGDVFKRLDSSDKAQILPANATNAWDCEAVTYPYVFAHKDQLWMLYNGNNFGKTGFGIARWIDSSK
jgi:predicted GH43/DUF377 family glycosyl hydrolase